MRRNYLIRNGLGLYRSEKTVTCTSMIGPRLGHAPPAARKALHTKKEKRFAETDATLIVRTNWPPLQQLVSCRNDVHVMIIIIIIYIRQSQQTEVFLLGALNDYEDA